MAWAQMQDLDGNTKVRGIDAGQKLFETIAEDPRRVLTSPGLQLYIHHKTTCTPMDLKTAAER
jgi:hypothetical protein